MEMKLQPTIKQSQQIVMTPKLQQAIKILQMPRMELSQYLTQQLTENPVLEETYDEVEESSEAETDDDLDESEIDLETGLSETDSATVEDLPELDIADDNFGDMDWKDYFETNGTGSSEWEEPEEDDRRNNDAVVTETLQDYLLWQLRMSIDSDLDYEIGETIIGEISDDGYLATDADDIAKSFGFDIADVDRLLGLIQNFDPTGCGSRNLEECLLIQLKAGGLENSLAYKLIEEGHLRDLGSNKYPQVAKSLGVGIDEVQEAIEEISNLESEPGRQFSPLRNEYIVPDVIIEKIDDKDDKYVIKVPDYGPGLRISSFYRDILTSNKQVNDDTRKFVQSKIDSALWVLESVESRRKTIQKVTKAIFDIQKEYLDNGDEALKPLTLREIAEMVDTHESTVSRAIRNRYVQTPQGMEKLKHFFGSGLSTKSGEMASSTSVKEIIKSIVENEDSKKPLSDKDIGTALSQKGIKIARRTIAKYREELNIPPSNKRKQW